MDQSQVGDPASLLESQVAAICDQHGAALFSLAVVLVPDRQQAEEAVVEVICAAPAQLTATSLRQELARRVYRRWVPRSLGDEQLERIAVALTHSGELNYRAVADLLGLQASKVVLLLNSALCGLSAR